MITKKFYEQETKTLSRKYARGQSPPERYINLCETHTLFLQSAILEELEYMYLFSEVLSLIQETYRPDHFIGVRGQIRIFSSEFMEYLLAISNQLTGRLKWDQVCVLYLNYDLWRIDWMIECKFLGDFREYAEKNISLKMLWNYCVKE